MFRDTVKIRAYAQIQENLCDLNENSTESDIKDLVAQIPKEFLSTKEDLIIICQLFAYYARCNDQLRKKISIHLFEQIMEPIKTYMQDESSFFWNIFGGLNYFKLWMHEEGLISIEQIVQHFKRNKCSEDCKFFLPEIIEEEPELFEKEIKNKLTFQYSESFISDFKELRKKHFKWLRESGNFHDEIYQEIEMNKLRLSIKRDDIDTFQQILSNSNMTSNSKICESMLENFTRLTNEMTLLEYAVGFSSIKISKFLIMNDADPNFAIFTAIRTRNYELIHLFESLCKDKFREIAFVCSISSWNFEMIEYLMNNYDYSFLEKNELSLDETIELNNIISDVCFSLNFLFLEKVLIPLFERNPFFIDKNISNILHISLEDYTGFFIKEFLKNPNVKINENAKSIINLSILEASLYRTNLKAFECILNVPDIDLSSEGYKNLAPFDFACAMYVDTKFINLLFKHPNFKIDPENAIVTCGSIGSSYIMKCVFDHFEDITIHVSEITMFRTIINNYLFSLKIMLEYHIRKNKITDENKLIQDFKEKVPFSEFDKDVMDIFKRIVHEVLTE